MNLLNLCPIENIKSYNDSVTINRESIFFYVVKEKKHMDRKYLTPCCFKGENEDIKGNKLSLMSFTKIINMGERIIRRDMNQGSLRGFNDNSMPVDSDSEEELQEQETSNLDQITNNYLNQEDEENFYRQELSITPITTVVQEESSFSSEEDYLKSMFRVMYTRCDTQIKESDDNIKNEKWIVYIIVAVNKKFSVGDLSHQYSIWKEGSIQKYKFDKQTKSEKLVYEKVRESKEQTQHRKKQIQQFEAGLGYYKTNRNLKTSSNNLCDIFSLKEFMKTHPSVANSLFKLSEERSRRSLTNKNGSLNLYGNIIYELDPVLFKYDKLKRCVLPWIPKYVQDVYCSAISPHIDSSKFIDDDDDEVIDDDGVDIMIRLQNHYKNVDSKNANKTISKEEQLERLEVLEYPFGNTMIVKKMSSFFQGIVKFEKSIRKENNGKLMVEGYIPTEKSDLSEFGIYIDIIEKYSLNHLSISPPMIDKLVGMIIGINDSFDITMGDHIRWFLTGVKGTSKSYTVKMLQDRFAIPGFVLALDGAGSDKSDMTSKSQAFGVVHEGEAETLFYKDRNKMSDQQKDNLCKKQEKFSSSEAKWKYFTTIETSGGQKKRGYKICISTHHQTMICCSNEKTNHGQAMDDRFYNILIPNEDNISLIDSAENVSQQRSIRVNTEIEKMVKVVSLLSCRINFAIGIGAIKEVNTRLWFTYMRDVLDEMHQNQIVEARNIRHLIRLKKFSIQSTIVREILKHYMVKNKNYYGKSFKPEHLLEISKSLYVDTEITYFTASLCYQQYSDPSAYSMFNVIANNYFELSEDTLEKINDQTINNIVGKKRGRFDQMYNNNQKKKKLNDESSNNVISDNELIEYDEKLEKAYELLDKIISHSIKNELNFDRKNKKDGHIDTTYINLNYITKKETYDFKRFVSLLKKDMISIPTESDLIRVINNLRSEFQSVAIYWKDMKLDDFNRNIKPMYQDMTRSKEERISELKLRVDYKEDQKALLLSIDRQNKKYDGDNGILIRMCYQVFSQNSGSLYTNLLKKHIQSEHTKETKIITPEIHIGFETSGKSTFKKFTLKPNKDKKLVWKNSSCMNVESFDLLSEVCNEIRSITNKPPIGELSDYKKEILTTKEEEIKENPDEWIAKVRIRELEL